MGRSMSITPFWIDLSIIPNDWDKGKRYVFSDNLIIRGEILTTDDAGNINVRRLAFFLYVYWNFWEKSWVFDIIPHYLVTGPN